MQTNVSFVIPVLNEQAIIGDLLAQLRQCYPDCELIVVDGGSTDQTVAVAMSGCDQLLIGSPGRAAQMNLGGTVASSEYVFFLHADSRPCISAAQLDGLLAQRPQWGFCRVRLSGPRRPLRIIEWFMNQRSRLTSVATGDQMLFVHGGVFERTGGFDLIALMEDVAYCKRLRQLCPPLIIPEPVVTSSRRWEEGGIVKTVLRMWALRLAYFCGVSPATLWRYYYER
jgi:rSAM/selenodomain-associated transferase 2